MTENNGASGNSPMPLDESWVLALLGSRTLLGKLTERATDLSFVKELAPVYQIEVRPQPQQSIDPVSKQPVMVVTRPRFIMGVCEMDGWNSLELPDAGIVLKPVVELSTAHQAELAQLVANYEAARAANLRKQKIDEQAAAMARTQNFGGGARKD